MDSYEYRNTPKSRTLNPDQTKRSNDNNKDNENDSVVVVVANPIDDDEGENNALTLAPATLLNLNSIQEMENGGDDSSNNIQIQNSSSSSSSRRRKRSTVGEFLFKPIHPQCNHISYGCLIISVFIFSGLIILLNTFLPVILMEPQPIPSSSIDNTQTTPVPSVSPMPSTRNNFVGSSPPSEIKSTSLFVFHKELGQTCPSMNDEECAGELKCVYVENGTPDNTSANDYKCRKTHGDQCSSDSDCESGVCGFETSNSSTSGSGEKQCCDEIWKDGICKAREDEVCDPGSSDSSCMDGIICARNGNGEKNNVCCNQIVYCFCSSFVCDCCCDSFDCPCCVGGV